MVRKVSLQRFLFLCIKKFLFSFLILLYGGMYLWCSLFFWFVSYKTKLTNLFPILSVLCLGGGGEWAHCWLEIGLIAWYPDTRIMCVKNLEFKKKRKVFFQLHPHRIYSKNNTMQRRDKNCFLYLYQRMYRVCVMSFNAQNVLVQCTFAKTGKKRN